jgi:hypothetical protein
MYLEHHLELCLLCLRLRCRDFSLWNLVLLPDPEQLRQGLDKGGAVRSECILPQLMTRSRGGKATTPMEFLQRGRAVHGLTWTPLRSGKPGA